MIYRKKLFTVNETIEIDFCEGKVISFNLFETKLKTKSGDIIHIPNSFITQKKLVLYKNKKEFLAVFEQTCEGIIKSLMYIK